MSLSQEDFEDLHYLVNEYGVEEVYDAIAECCEDLGIDLEEEDLPEMMKEQAS